MIKQIIIKPLIGIEGLSLGLSMEEVVSILGKPDKRSLRKFKDGSCDKYWDYLTLGLELTFSSDNNWLLGRITAQAKDSKLEGKSMIGLDEMKFLEMLKKTNISPIALEDDFRELDSKNYVCDKLGLSFWVHEGELESITIFPEYDKTGDIPLWPEKPKQPESPDIDESKLD